MTLTHVGHDVRGEVGRLAFSMREAAAALGICERSVWQAIKDGKLKAARFGRSVRIHRDELERFVREAESEVSQ